MPSICLLCFILQWNKYLSYHFEELYTI